MRADEHHPVAAFVDVGGAIVGALVAVPATMTLRVIVVMFAFVGVAHAGARGTFRLGVLPLDLTSSRDTPLFGSSIHEAVDDYNAAAMAYDERVGSTTARIDAADLGLNETLLVFAPGLELGEGIYFFRVEAPVGVADDLRSIGVGLYPLNAQFVFGRSVAVYGSLGGSASWLDRPGPGDRGGLVMARVAAGLRLAQHLVVEVGYNAFALGGTVNQERLANMSTGEPLPAPNDVVAAGEAHGIVDASLGVAF